ncbi:protein tyrosine phosphatase family protein [Sphingomonas immobilis]|uniref:Protein tyrosine phosphatase family protein n=1 Tax=Sphingomonas immobilis TaxID=3063997 RepID=A0ABT9A0L6_9SPHN|nr:protein tyrosine phosphatase family protein [Sphingomonas sp. CA1-15]MDO7842242.1 protein tyrosine phosphatase family protein [Sphingomonas sp. CA1-15]
MDDPVAITNWRRIDARLTTSGQPDEAQLAAIRALGVEHVVNLALHEHPRALPDERAAVTALGMAYHHIPVDFDAPTEADFAKFCAVLAEAGDRPLHVHCIVNARVTAFVTRYFREVQGMADAREQARLDSVWRPGGVWAQFLGDEESVGEPHRYAGRDY